MNYIYRILLTFNATSLIIVVFFIKEEITINSICKYFSSLPDYISYIIYFLIPIFLTYVSLRLSNHLATAVIDKSSIIEVENANNAFLPSYLGYFFVALSVTNFNTLIFIFVILFIFTFLSQTLYFNPLFLLFGYHFYNISTKNKAKIFIISKNEIIKPDDVEFSELKRINTFTFIDKNRI
ncbi:hypothetical protein ABC895_09525 [Capnocytophaga sputigena]|uniref:hypothetical protein n=2 Tax=Capnocytophaga sputigena TaxID=1019 RepID=UPI0031F484AC